MIEEIDKKDALIDESEEIIWETPKYMIGELDKKDALRDES